MLVIPTLQADHCSILPERDGLFLYFKEAG